MQFVQPVVEALRVDDDQVGTIADAQVAGIDTDEVGQLATASAHRLAQFHERFAS